MFSARESGSRQLPETRTGAIAGPIDYLQPQQSNGVLEEIQTRNKIFRVQIVETELCKNQYSCYKIWMLAQPVIAVGVIWGLCSWMAVPNRTIPTWPLVISVLLVIWNAVQSIVEFLAITQKKFSKADKALKSFCLFFTVLFICTIVMSLTVFNEVMASAASGWRIAASVIVSFGVIVLFYLCNLSGAVKVYQLLKKKSELQEAILDQSIDSRIITIVS